MNLSPITIIGFALLLLALASVPDQYKPDWFSRLTWWQVLIGLIATFAAFVIIMSPEFYALGLLGDSTFFDLLALAIGLQLQIFLSRSTVYLAAAGAKIIRFLRRRYAVVSVLLALTAAGIFSVITAAVSRALRMAPD
jgi:hypothetical protein